MGAWSQQNVSRVAFRLATSYPATNLGNPTDPLDDLLYIILSGQTNEALYQSTFQALKAAYPGWRGLAKATVSDIEKIIAGGGLARQKASYIKSIMERIELERGEPSLQWLQDLCMEEAEKYLANLPGVGIKTARCVLMYTLDREVFPADVNCLRIMERLGWLKWEGRRAELFADTAQDLIPTHLRRTLHVDLVQHGRAVCVPGTPRCDRCCLEDLCPTSGKRERLGLTVVDLCCGAGGFAWGFMQAGCEILLGVDTERHALATFTANVPGAKPLKLDITEKKAVDEILACLNGQRPQIVIAGPPCQGFSRAGSRKLDDPRNKVLNAAVRTAVKLRPQVIVVENVLYLRGPSFIPFLRKAMGVVRRAGYRVEYTIRLRHPSQGIPAMIMIEQRRTKRQQDFVDLGQTEPIKPTIKIDMDWRQPVTKLVKELVEKVPIFAEQFIEFRRPSIRKNSTNLFSLSNLKTSVQAMLLGNTRLGAADAQRRLTEKLAGPNYDRLRDVIVDYFSRLAQEVECFRDILEDPDSTDYIKVREQNMCLNSVGLAVMGMVGHEVILGRAIVENTVEAVAKINWNRDNPLWEGTLRVGPGVARGGNVIELGGSIVKAAGGLPLTDKDIERLKAVDGLSEKLPPGCLEKPAVLDVAADNMQDEMAETSGTGGEEAGTDEATAGAIEANELVAAGAKGGE